MESLSIGCSSSDVPCILEDTLDRLENLRVLFLDACFRDPHSRYFSESDVHLVYDGLKIEMEFH
jgi:hypothetical protein